jgi:hypothetical protein
MALGLDRGLWGSGGASSHLGLTLLAEIRGNDRCIMGCSPLLAMLWRGVKYIGFTPLVGFGRRVWGFG